MDQLTASLSGVSIGFTMVMMVTEIFMTCRRLYSDDHYTRELRARKSSCILPCRERFLFTPLSLKLLTYSVIWSQGACNVALSSASLLQALNVYGSCPLHQHFVFFAGLATLIISGGLCAQMRQWIHHEYVRLDKDSAVPSHRHMYPQ